jgi:hypothetical protein
MYADRDVESELVYVDTKPEDIELPGHMRMEAAKHSPHYVKKRGSGRSGGGGVIG